MITMLVRKISIVSGLKTKSITIPVVPEVIKMILPSFGSISLLYLDASWLAYSLSKDSMLKVPLWIGE